MTTDRGASSGAGGASPGLLLVALLWGATFATGKAAVHDVPALTVATLRFGLASIALLPVLWHERRGRPPTSIPFEGWRALLLLAFTAVFAYNALFFGGLQRAPSTDSILLTPTTNPVWTALFAALLLRERLSQRLTIAMGFALLGMLLVLLGGAGQGYDRARLMGNVMFVTAAMVFGLSHVVGRVATRYVSPIAATTIAGLLGTAMLLPAAVLQGGLSTLLDASTGFWSAIGFIAFGGTALAYVLWYRGVTTNGAGHTAFYTNLVPVVGLTLSAVFLGERPAPLQIAGGAVMLGAVLWGTRRRTRAPVAQSTPRVSES